MTDTAEAPAPVVYTDEHPEFPKLLYNEEGQTKAAANQEEEEKLSGEGWSEDAPPPDAGKLTDADIAQLKTLLQDFQQAAGALAKLLKITGDDTPAPPTI